MDADSAPSRRGSGVSGEWRLGTVSATGVTPAQAVTPHPITATSAEEIVGEPWSGPAFEITYSGSSARISCTPEKPSGAKPERL